MNKDVHLLYEKYRLIKEGNVWHKIASMLGIDPESLTQDDADKALYSHKKRDVSFEGWQAVRNYFNTRIDPKYSNFAIMLPARGVGESESPEKIILNYITRLDGAKQSLNNPLNFYNTKNPNWFWRAYSDERAGEGPFSHNWNWQQILSARKNSLVPMDQGPLSFEEIYDFKGYETPPQQQMPGQQQMPVYQYTPPQYFKP